MLFGLPYLFVLSSLLLVALGVVLYAGSIGVRAYRQSRQAAGLHATALRFLALNLCEPLVNCVGVPALGFLLAYVAAPFIMHRFQSCSALSPDTNALSYACTTPGVVRIAVAVGTVLLMTTPMAVLLVPVRGLRFPQPYYRMLSRQLVQLGLTRWSITLLTHAVVPVFGPYLGFGGVVFILPLLVLGIGVLFATARWGRRQLRGPLVAPHAVGGSPVATVMQ